MVLKTKIKCPVCGGKAILSKASIQLLNNAITLKGNPIYKCSKCFESFATGEIVDKTLASAKKEFNFVRQVVSSGGSLAITLPTDISKYYNLSKGSKVKLIPQSKKEMKIVTV